MRSLLLLPVFSACLAAQTAVVADPARLLRDGRTAILDDSLATAVALAGKLNAALQAFIVCLLDDDERQLTLRKLSSAEYLQIPVRRVLEVLLEAPHQKQRTLALKGRVV